MQRDHMTEKRGQKGGSLREQTLKKNKRRIEGDSTLRENRLTEEEDAF